MKTVIKKSPPIRRKKPCHCFPPLCYLPILALLYFSFIAWRDFKAFKSREIKVHMGDLVQGIDTVFIHPVIYIVVNKHQLSSRKNPVASPALVEEKRFVTDAKETILIVQLDKVVLESRMSIMCISSGRGRQ